MALNDAIKDRGKDDIRPGWLLSGDVEDLAYAMWSQRIPTRSTMVRPVQHLQYLSDPSGAINLWGVNIQTTIPVRKSERKIKMQHLTFFAVAELQFRKLSAKHQKMRMIF